MGWLTAIVLSVLTPCVTLLLIAVIARAGK